MKFLSPTLYVKHNCPFCEDVLNTLAEMGKVVAIVDIKNHPSWKNEIGSNKPLTPMLKSEDECITGSKEIILWLYEHKHMLKDLPPSERL